MRKVTCSNCGTPTVLDSDPSGGTSFLCNDCRARLTRAAVPPPKTKKGGIPHGLRTRDGAASKNKILAKTPKP